MNEGLGKNASCDCKCIHKEKTELAIRALKEIGVVDKMSDFFKNFADTTRLKILAVLDKVDSMCVCDIAVALNMTKSAISHQLKYLKNYNLVKSIKTGKTVFYMLSDDHVKDIIEKGIEHLQEK